MSRTVGPYKDVATARVEGAYELCEGADETGRPVQILTLGSASSKDPARRGLLSDTVAWAYATAGPEDAPILVADLEAEQPYVVVLRDPRMRGADRIMDRLLALGPATGPLPVGPPSQPNRPQAPASPAAPNTGSGRREGHFSAPPMSPQVAIPPPKKRSQLKPILIGVSSVLAMIALVVGGWIIWSTLAGGESDGSAPAVESADEQSAAGADEESPEGDAESPRFPEWNPDSEGMSVAGSSFEEGDETSVVSLEGWPFAFLVPPDYECHEVDRTADCTAPDGQSTVLVSWSVCEDDCDDDVRERLQEELPYQPLQVYENGDIGFSVREPPGEWKASLSVFVAIGDQVLHVTAVASMDADLAETDAQPILNDVLNQSKLLEDSEE
ncbi:hypothetical protein GCM10029992_10630 [Glycomyces albus]